MKTVGKLTLLLTLLLVSTKLFAQEKRTYMYLGTSVEKEFSKKLSAGINLQGRFCNDPNTQDILVTPKIEFAPIKFVSFGAEYRVDYSREKGEESEWNGRLGLFVKGKYSIHKILKFEGRIKYCNYTEDAYLDGENQGNKQYLRYKLGAEVKIKPLNLSPYFTYEIFDNLSRNTVDKLRYVWGAKYKINKQHTIGFEYALEQRFNLQTKKGNAKEDINKNIFSFYYKYTFPFKKEK